MDAHYRGQCSEERYSRRHAQWSITPDRHSRHITYMYMLLQLWALNHNSDRNPSRIAALGFGQSCSRTTYKAHCTVMYDVMNKLYAWFCWATDYKEMPDVITAFWFHHQSTEMGHTTWRHRSWCICKQTSIDIATTNSNRHDRTARAAFMACLS